MKKITLITLLVVACVAAFGQDGIRFESLTFKEALAKAKCEKKLVFLDCYTSWCGPCKAMADEIFPLKKAGDYFNPRFVSIKLDMEKGEGIELDKKLEIAGYPTFFIFTPNGHMQHKIMGGSPNIEVFINRIEKGMKKETSYGYLRDLYEAGKINKKQLINYKLALMDAFETRRLGEVDYLIDSLLTAEDKLGKEYWPIMKGYGSDDFKFVVNNLSKFRKRIGKQDVNRYLFNNFHAAIFKALDYDSKANRKKLEQIHEELQVLDLPHKEVLITEIEIAEVMRNENVPALVQALKKYSEYDNIDFELIFSMIRSIPLEEGRELIALYEPLLKMSGRATWLP